MDKFVIPFVFIFKQLRTSMHNGIFNDLSKTVRYTSLTSFSITKEQRKLKKMPTGKQYTEFHIWHNYGGALSRQVALWRQQQGIMWIGYFLNHTSNSV